MKWLDALDSHLAVKNVIADSYGDWYRDPWSWAELPWLVDNRLDLLEARLEDGGTKRTVSLDVPKENFVTRPALLLDPLDRLAYQAIVDSLSRLLIGELPPWAYGWRLPSEEPEAGKYLASRDQWPAYRSQLKELATQYEFALVTDIVSFFASIDLDTLKAEMSRVRRPNKVTERLFDLLYGWNRIRGREGLPQRALASSVLAQFYLRPLDDLIDNDSGIDGPIAPCRWMDDIWLFSDNPLKLRMLQLKIQDRLRDMGLNINAGKTDVLDGNRLAREVGKLEHSAADTALHEDVLNSRPLEELLDEIFEAPSNAPRTNIRFVTTRMRRHKLFDRVGDFVDHADFLPHAADHLARLFRDSGTWRDLQDWYVDYCRSNAASLTWSVYQLGTMFPASEYPKTTLVSFLKEEVASGRAPLVLLPLAIQRLAEWDRASIRELIDGVSRQQAYAHPFAHRALGLVGVMVGARTAWVETLLRQYQETTVTLEYLRDRSFAAADVSRDFAG